MNYNDPIEVVHVFWQEDKILGRTEYGVKVSFLWEDLRKLEEYAYPDNWVTYKGPKCTVILEGEAQGRVILSDYITIKQHWTNYRRSCPVYVT